MRLFPLNPLALAAVAICTAAHAQDTSSTTAATSGDGAAKQVTRDNTATTSNTTQAGASQRALEQAQQTVTVLGSRSIAGGLMSVQSAPKAVSTLTREAIQEASPGSNYSQLIDTIPGVVSSSDDSTGLFDGNYQIRGFTNDEIGVTVNGAPLSDSGNYAVYATEYGDYENMNDITVLQGYPDVDQAVAGAAGGTIAWSTINPSHNFGVDTSLVSGANSYKRQFMRVQTGDTGPIRSWVSFSNNTTHLWRGLGGAKVDKAEAKSVWTIDAQNSVSASVQWNRQIRIGGYEKLTKAQAAANYYTNYDTTQNSTGTDTYFWKQRTNVFKDYVASLDGEFTLSDSLRLSVVPYFQYGTGGSGVGKTFYENATSTYYGYEGDYPRSLDGSTTASKQTLVYSFNGSDTWRPGVIAKMMQDFGENDTLTYGFWFDAARHEQRNVFTPLDANGDPLDIWARNDRISYYYNKDGTSSDVAQNTYQDYTTTKLKRVFVSNDWTPTSKLTVTVAGAYTDVERKGIGCQYCGATGGSAKYTEYGSYSDRTWKKFTPSAGLKFQLDSADQLYLGYGRSFRAPVDGVITQSAAALGYSGSTLTDEQKAEIANTKPESADTLDMGWRYYAGDLSASVDVYAANLKNKSVSGYDEASGQTLFVSVPELRQRGLNAEANYKLTRDLSVYGSYSLTKSTIGDNTDTYGDGIYPTAGKSFVNVPKNVFHLGSRYQQSGFWLSATANYRGSFWADWMNTEKAPGYTTVNLSTGYHFADVGTWLKKPTLKINVSNLTDRKALTYTSPTSFLTTKGALNGTAYSGSYYNTSGSAATYNLLAPRAITVSLNASF